MSTILVGDGMRVAILALGGGVLGLSGVTCWVYGRRYYTDAKLAHAQGRRLAWRGLLPSHVLWATVSYVLLTVVALHLVFGNLATQPTWRTVAILVAMAAGMWSMWRLLKWQRRLYPRHDDNPPITDVFDPPDPPPPARNCGGACGRSGDVEL